MLLEEFNEQDYYEFLEERGREKGKKEGKLETIRELLQNNTPEQIIQMGVDKELVEEAMKTADK